VLRAVAACVTSIRLRRTRTSRSRYARRLYLRIKTRAASLTRGDQGASSPPLHKIANHSRPLSFQGIRTGRSDAVAPYQTANWQPDLISSNNDRISSFESTQMVSKRVQEPNAIRHGSTLALRHHQQARCHGGFTILSIREPSCSRASRFSVMYS
jgi:hypothetical protein